MRKTEYPCIPDCQYPEHLIPGILDRKSSCRILTADPQFTAQIGFNPSGRSIPQDFKTVQYKGASLLKKRSRISIPIDILDPSKAPSWQRRKWPVGCRCPTSSAPAISGIARTLLSVLQKKETAIWFSATSCTTFLKYRTRKSARHLLRLEDISAEEDPAVLRKFADYLHDRNIPFQISLSSHLC